YFPRLIVPLSVLVSNLIKLVLQMAIFFVAWVYFLSSSPSLHPNWQYIWLFPLLVLMMAGLGFGFGILISSLTTKYRDFTFLVAFGIQLMMYASPVVYPMSIVSHKLKVLLLLNPVSAIIECFKFIFLGKGYFSWVALGYSGAFMLVLIFISVAIFNKVEKTFMDTV
ncbi:MAG: ABC transporter permease, partial [Bacteroidia bacterium]